MGFHTPKSVAAAPKLTVPTATHQTHTTSATAEHSPHTRRCLACQSASSSATSSPQALSPRGSFQHLRTKSVSQKQTISMASNGETQQVDSHSKEEQAGEPDKRPGKLSGSPSKRMNRTGSSSKRINSGAGALPGGEAVLGLVKEYIAPSRDGQQQEQHPGPASPRAPTSPTRALHRPASPQSPRPGWSGSPRAAPPKQHAAQHQQQPTGASVLAPSSKAPLPTHHPAVAPAVAASIGAAAPGPSPLSVGPLATDLLPAVGVSSNLSSEQLGVLGAWYSLYCPEREAQQQMALVKHYDERARFEDNFVQVFGRDQIGVQFYGMRRCVKGISLAMEKVELVDNGGSAGTYTLRIISRIAFHYPALIRGPLTSIILAPALEAWATDTLTVRSADHQVTHHQQRVHNIPCIPWPVRVYLGVSTSLFMMHVLGW